jgi:hypothetical protein
MSGSSYVPWHWLPLSRRIVTFLFHSQRRVCARHGCGHVSPNTTQQRSCCVAFFRSHDPQTNDLAADFRCSAIDVTLHFGLSCVLLGMKRLPKLHLRNGPRLCGRIVGR